MCYIHPPERLVHTQLFPAAARTATLGQRRGSRDHPEHRARALGRNGWGSQSSRSGAGGHVPHHDPKPHWVTVSLLENTARLLEANSIAFVILPAPLGQTGRARAFLLRHQAPCFSPLPELVALLPMPAPEPERQERRQPRPETAARGARVPAASSGLQVVWVF